MRFLVAEKLGPHKFKTPEGYLICTDAILSRTGKQEYKRCELFGDTCEDPDKIVNVERTDDEVFSDKAMASFENKAVCIEHPDRDVNAENHNELAVGFVRDIHKGEDNGKPVMMGTLVITDKDAVEAVESGEYKELSCGYDCDIDDDGEPCQRNIRGNHVALCKQGRAGIARIVDSVDDARFWGQQYPYELWLTYPKTGRKFMAGAFKTHEEARRNTDRLRKEFTHNVDGIPNAEIRENFRDSVNDAGIKVWQVHQGYAIVVKRYWKQYGRNAFVDATESSIEAARYHRGSLERNDKMEFVIIDCNDGKYKIEDSEMKDIQSTKAPGTDKIIYVMQSDIDKNLYFYIGKTFSMKEGSWGYTKFEMGDTTPEQLKAELSKNGWHAVSQGVARIIDAEHEVVTDEIMKDESRQTLIEKLRTVSVPYGERYALTSGSGWHIDIQHHGQASYENINKYPHVAPKESSKATIRLWYNGKHMKTFEGPLNSAKSDAIRYLQTRTEDSWLSVEEENYNKANKPVEAKDETEKNFKIYVKNVFGAYKVADWPAVSKEAAVKEFLEANPAYRKKGVIEARDASIADANVIMSGEHNDVGNNFYGYFSVDHPKLGNFYVSFKIKGRRKEVQLDGTGWNFIKSKGYTSEQKAWITQHKSDLERISGMGTVADSKEQLFTVEYKQGDTTYVRKVKASTIQDAIKQVKSELTDDRLSPMTYKRLKELGVTSQQWSNWTQEQASAYIARRKQNSNTSSNTKNTSSNTKNTSSTSLSKAAQRFVNKSWSAEQFVKTGDLPLTSSEKIPYIDVKPSEIDAAKELLASKGLNKTTVVKEGGSTYLHVDKAEYQRYAESRPVKTSNIEQLYSAAYSRNTGIDANVKQSGNNIVVTFEKSRANKPREISTNRGRVTITPEYEAKQALENLSTQYGKSRVKANGNKIVISNINGK